MVDFKLSIPMFLKIHFCHIVVITRAILVLRWYLINNRVMFLTMYTSIMKGWRYLIRAHKWRQVLETLKCYRFGTKNIKKKDWDKVTTSKLVQDFFCRSLISKWNNCLYHADKSLKIFFAYIIKMIQKVPNKEHGRILQMS